MGLIFKTLCTMVKKSLIEDDEALVRFEKLRSSRVNMLKIKIHRTNVLANDVEIVGAQIYNSLPDELRQISSLKLFKLRLKGFLLSKSRSLVTTQQIYTKNRLI